MILTILVVLALFLNSSFSSTLKSDQINVLRQPLMKSLTGDFCNCELVYVGERTKGMTVFQDELYLFGKLDFSTWNPNSAGVITVSFGVNITYPRHKDIHRYIPTHCSLAIILLRQFKQNVVEWLKNTLIPRYAPILRKDQDHFLFILPSEELASQFLLSPDFGGKIKYKLAIYYGEPASVFCTTVDLYGNGGNPRLKVLRKFTLMQNLNNNYSINLLFPDWTTNFNGKVFRFAIPKVAFRFEIERRQADGRYHPKRGFYKWWLDEAMHKFNFTYDIFRASYGGGTGKLLENGSWVGATGDIFYGKADCSFIVGEIYSRHKFLGWSSSISYEWVVFMTHAPRNSYSPKAIFKPFTPLVWCLFFLTLVLMTASLKFATVMTVDPETLHCKWSLVKMLQFIFSTLLEQDPVCPIRSHSIRLLCAFWFIYAITTATLFRGKLVSLIAFPVSTWVPTTFEELANSHFKVALNVVGKAGAAYVLIATSTSPIFKTLAARMELIPEAENCLERAMREDLGCIIWKGIADYAMVKNLTDKHGRVPLQESSQIALFIGDGLMLVRFSLKVYERRAIFGEHLDRTIQAVVQMGLTIKWFRLDQQFIKKERRIWENSSSIPQVTYDYNDDGPKKMVMSQFTGLFILCIVGFVISSGQLFFEITRYTKSEPAYNNNGMHVGGVSTNEDLLTTNATEILEVLRRIERKRLFLSKHKTNWHHTKL